MIPNPETLKRRNAEDSGGVSDHRSAEYPVEFPDPPEWHNTFHSPLNSGRIFTASRVRRGTEFLTVTDGERSYECELIPPSNSCTYADEVTWLVKIDPRLQADLGLTETVFHAPPVYGAATATAMFVDWVNEQRNAEILKR